jgi:prevent-host-death family protein
MKPVPIHEAKLHLSQLIERACSGEEIVIARGQRPVVKLVPIEHAAPERKFGALRGEVVVDDGFFEPLPEEELRAWKK